jgi:hypothetical protein
MLREISDFVLPGAKDDAEQSKRFLEVACGHDVPQPRKGLKCPFGNVSIKGSQAG